MEIVSIISISIIAISIIVIFSIKLYKTYKTHKAKNISYSILMFSIVFASALLIALIQKLSQTELPWKLKLETINIPLLITIYFIVGTLYIIYIKKLYEEAEAIEKELEEKGIIDIDKVFTE